MDEEYRKILATHLNIIDVTTKNSLFHHQPEGWQTTWVVYGLWGQYLGYIDEELRHIPLVSGQMYNPQTGIWSVLDARTGRIIDGLESKAKYEFIAELSSDNLERGGR